MKQEKKENNISKSRRNKIFTECGTKSVLRTTTKIRSTFMNIHFAVREKQTDTFTDVKTTKRTHKHSTIMNAGLKS